MIPFKSYLHTQKRKKWKKKTIIPCRQNLLWSIRPFLELIQFFVLGASLSNGKPPKRGCINQRRETSLGIEPGKVLDLAHQKAYCSGVVRSSSLPSQARFHYLSLERGRERFKGDNWYVDRFNQKMSWLLFLGLPDSKTCLALSDSY